MVEHVEVRRGAYRDSVTLMQVSRAVAAAPGVVAAQVAMATDLNLDVIRAMGFTLPEGTGPNDLLIALRAQDDAGLAAGMAEVERALSARAGAGGSGGSGGGGAGAPAAPRTTGAAVRASGAPLVLVSTPGQHAFAEAMDALEAGANVMVFSDNVPVEQEVRLKDEAAARGLLVMGPDCGTAVVGGVGLGFANVVAPGPVGVVAASGTGAQQVLCLLDAAGVGVSHCLGVGGRDLSAAVAGRSTRQALALLDADPRTELILVVSKPPDAAVEADLRAYADTLATPVRWALMGAGRPDLTAATQDAVLAVGGAWPRELGRDAVDLRAAQAGYQVADDDGSRGVRVAAPDAYAVLRGAFSGGTLCDEAMVIASAALGPLPSNIPLAGAPAIRPLDGGLDPLQHAFVDFGDDDLTRGRPHPMIDNALRAQWIAQVARTAGEPGRGVVLLLDVVLGHGAHPDPASELAPALDEASTIAAGRGVPFEAVVSLCGTASDPQDLRRQWAAFADRGITVELSNADAVRQVLSLLGQGLSGATGGSA